MKKYSTYLVVGICVLSFIYPAKAQKQSLDAVISMALENNLGLKASEKEIVQKETMVGTWKEIPKTSFDLQYGNIQLPNVGDYAFSAMQSFKHPAVNKARKELLESLVKQSKTEQEIRELGIKMAARENYYAMAFQSKIVDFLSNQDTLFSKAINRAAVKYKAGETSVLEQKNLEIERAALQNRIRIAQKNRAMEQNKLEELTQWKNGPLFINNEELEKELLLSYESEQIPFLDRFDRLQEINQNHLGISQASLKPDFMGGITNQSMNSNLSQFIVSGGVSIPIFQKSEKAKIAAYQIEQQVIAAQRTALQSQIQLELSNLEIELKAIKNEISYLNQSALPQVQELIEIAQKQYLLGDITYLEYQQSFKQSLQIQELYLNKLLEQKRIEINIIYLQGK